LNTALRWRLVVRNAAMLVDSPRTVAHEIQPLTPEQAQRLLKMSQGHRLDGLVTVALLRPSPRRDAWIAMVGR
jgi:hypothetical protein